MIDGELYIHGKNLQTLNSLIRNDNNSSEQGYVQFMAYDVDVTQNGPIGLDGVS